MDPETLRFTKTHEWISPDGAVGISDHAQHEITDVVFVEPPAVGRSVKAGDPCAVVESVKAAFDIYAPIDGTVTAVNEEAAKNPALLNQSPYGAGWIYRLQMAAATDREKLMTHAGYKTFLAENAGSGSPL